MEFAVNARGEKVGSCSVLDRGLYWKIECIFYLAAKKPMRLFGGGRSLGLPVCSGDKWSLDKTVSKSSLPGFPPQEGDFYVLDAESCCITVHGYSLQGYFDQQGEQALFRIPGLSTAPHPCMPLVCFFSYRDGFWVLKLDENGSACF